VFRFNKANLGFTLIELLIVIAVLGVIMTTSVITFSRFNNTQNLNIAYDDVRNALSEAKSNANSQVVIKCTGELQAYEVVFDTANKRYSLREVCTVPIADPIVKTYTLPKGNISFRSIPASGYVRFNTLTGVSSGGRVVLTNGTPSQDKTITVEASGVIR
jgi:prepilin-type N-terminal cleavage/methylation domain-containing protein